MSSPRSAVGARRPRAGGARAGAIAGERTLRTPTATDLLLAPGAVVWLRAPVFGDVHVGPGSRCHVLAPIHGTVHVDRGIVVLGEHVTGGIRVSAATSPGAVRTARARGRRRAQVPPPRGVA